MSKFKDYTDGIDALEYCLSGELETLMQKSLLYEKLSKELGCPLEVVFKAIKKGIETKKQYYIGSGQEYEKNIIIIEPFLIYTHTENDLLENMDYFKKYANQWCFLFEDFEYTEDGDCEEFDCLIRLKDYQKTWFLKGEKNG